MHIGKFKIDDLVKAMKSIALSRSPNTFVLSVDGPSIILSYTGDDGKLIQIHLYDESTATTPTITKTDRL